MERAGKREELAVTPRKTTAGSIRIGIAFGQVEGLDFLGGGPITHVRQNPIEQIAICVRGMGNTLGALFAPKSSIKVEQLSGPVGIISHYLLALMSPEGLRYALWFSVFLNVNLAILNMMPFPVLDGGHIVLSLFEMIRRRPLNVKIVEALQTGFALLLFGLFFFLTFKDVLDIPKWFGFERSSEQMEFTKPSAKKTG
jgi:regulator of sigma E protease